MRTMACAIPRPARPNSIQAAPTRTAAVTAAVSSAVTTSASGEKRFFLNAEASFKRTETGLPPRLRLSYHIKSYFARVNGM